MHRVKLHTLMNFILEALFPASSCIRLQIAVRVSTTSSCTYTIGRIQANMCLPHFAKLFQEAINKMIAVPPTLVG